MKTIFDRKDSFCSYCGVLFNTCVYPKHCDNCMQYAWGNPIPVVIGLLPVKRNNNEYGLIIQQRNIDPGKGEWALPGGYVNHKEDWREAIVREVKEELNLVTESKEYQVTSVVSGKDNATLLVFCYYNGKIELEELSLFKPNDEVQAVDVMWHYGELAFPSHTKAVNDMIALQRYCTDADLI